MARNGKPDRILMYSVRLIIISLFLFAITSVSSAEMPDFERVSSLPPPISSPGTVAIDSNENVYVTESIYNQLLIYTHLGEYSRTLAGLSRPISVAVDENGRIVVGNHFDNISDRANVAVYDADLNYLFKLGAGDDEFSQPNAISIDSVSDKIYVVDKVDNIIKVYNYDGSFDFSFDGTSNGGGQFAKPSSIVIDKVAEEVIVLDRPLVGSLDGARIQIFNMNGAFISGFSKYGINSGEMFKPKHLTVDDEGRIYVTDSQHNVVLVYEKNGTYLGAVYDQSYPMSTPKGIAISGGNKLFIALLSLKRVDVYGVGQYTLMEVSPLSLTFEGETGGTTPALQGVEIDNSGTGTLNWTAVANDNWITLSDAAGSAAPVSYSSLNVGVDFSALTTGTYNGSISITAESGAEETVDVELTVAESSLVVVHGGPYEGQEGEIILFDASQSSGNIILYEWDLDSDGTYKYSDTSPIQEHVYTELGSHFLTLKITDNLGETREATTTVKILDALPTAEFSSSATGGEAPLTVTFTNGSTGYDQPLTYEWDFDNDGTVDSTDENPSHDYNDEGTYSVKLTVRDSDGSTNILIKTDYITVTAEGSGECYNFPARIGNDGYSTIQAAYDTAIYGDVIMIRAESINESLNLDRDITVTMTGGYKCDYSVIEGTTTLNGDINNINGTLIIENFILN